MINEEKIKFSKMLNTVNRMYSTTSLTNDDLGAWWYKLKRYDYNEVAIAFDKWTSAKEFMPKPSQIISIISGNLAYRYPKLNKPKIDPKLAFEKLKQLKDKLGWNR